MQYHYDELTGHRTLATSRFAIGFTGKHNAGWHCHIDSEQGFIHVKVWRFVYSQAGK
jgi:hypothetical protein